MELFRDLRLGAFTSNVAVSGSARFIRKHIVDDSVVVIGRDAVRHMVKLQRVPQTPGDIVIGAGRIAADAEPADNVAAGIEREAAAKHDHSA